MAEIEHRWAQINGYPGYEISDAGVVRHGDRILKQSTDRYGYQRIFLRFNGKPKLLTIHRLVALHFVGDCPDGFACAHLDGNKKNNSWKNLAFVTTAENNRHMRLHGTQARGEKHGQTRLTERDVVAIRNSYVRKSKMNNSYVLARRYGVDAKIIMCIVSGRTWGHLRAARQLNEDLK